MYLFFVEMLLIVWVLRFRLHLLWPGVLLEKPNSYVHKVSFVIPLHNYTEGDYVTYVYSKLFVKDCDTHCSCLRIVVGLFIVR